MKTYKIVFTFQAREEALAAAEYIAQTAPLTAARWYEGLEAVVRKLDSFPNRCALAPESEFLGEELRHSIYTSYRIIFRVEEATQTVRILHVRHGSRRAIGEPEPED